MDRLITGIQNLSPPVGGRQGEAAHRDLLLHLKQSLPDLKNVSPGDVVNALQALGTHQSVGFAAVLAHGIAGESFGDPRLPEYALRWMLECSADAIKCIPAEVAAIARAFAVEAEGGADKAKQTLWPLFSLLAKIQPSREHMTPVHAAALKAALLANHCRFGYQLVQTTLYQLGDTCLTSTDYLLYCYYGGLVCIGCRQLARASELLLLAITMPTQVPDAIIVAAWQKYVMIHALQTGELAEIPKHTPHHTCRVLRDQAPLNRLVTAFAASDRPDMEATLSKNTKYFLDAGLLGLATQLLDKIVTRKIQRLTATYRTLALADIALEAGLESADAAELHILKMIAAGEMQAKIDEVAGMVCFEEDTHDDSPALAAAIQEKSKIIMELQGRLKAAVQEATLEPKYVQKVLSQNRSRQGASAMAAGTSTMDA